MPEGLQFGKGERQGLDTDRRIVGDFVDELYDIVELRPAAGVAAGGASDSVIAHAATRRQPVILFANTADGNYDWTARVRSEFTKRVAILAFWYTSDVGSTATFDITWSVTAYPGSGALAGALMAVVGSNTSSYAGPAVALDSIAAASLVLSSGFVTSAHHNWIGVSCKRTVADANANAFILTGATIQLVRP